jgi:hypothetical protein
MNVLLVLALALSPAALAKSTALTPAWVGAWYEADKAVLITITTSNDRITVTFEVPDSEAGVRRTMPCEKPRVTPSGTLQCSIAHPESAHSEQMTFELALVGPDHLTFGPSNVPVKQTCTRVSTASESWRADLDRQLTLGRAGSETQANVTAIRWAELAYDAAFDTFLPADVTPRPLASLTQYPARWVGDTAFAALGWAPSGDVLGCYAVTTSTSADGVRHFQVDGWVDAEGDGTPAHWVATDTSDATRVGDP